MRSGLNNPLIVLPALGILLVLATTVIAAARFSDHLSASATLLVPLTVGVMLALVFVAMVGLRRQLERQEKQIREQVKREYQYEERYRDLIENANDIVFTTDLSGGIVSFNRAGERITGYSRDEIRGLTLQHLAELNERTINRCLKSPESMTVEMVILSKQGDRVHLEVSTRPLHQEGQLAGIEGIARDVTLRKRAEEELRRAYRLQTLHIDNSPLAVIEWDCDFRVSRWSRRAEELFGWRAEEAKGKSPHELRLIHPDDVALSRGMFQNLLRHSKINQSVRHRNLTKTGEVVHCEWYSSSLFGEQDELISILSLIHDGTEQNRAEQTKLELEEQVRHAHKMEAVGRLAGGIAHDFNNLLTVINGNSLLLQQRVGLDSTEYEILDEIVKAGEQAASLTRQLLAFSRKQILAPTTLDLNSIIGDVRKLLCRLLPVNIEVELILDPFLMSIKADPGLMTQMLLNLAVNARDAMPSGGKLTVRTLNGNNGWTRLEVEDNGCGMDEATRNRIFEPFFTTKAVGAGTGLGLSTVYNIVQQSNGRIEIESAVGEGTLFRIYLPCSASVPVMHASPKPEMVALPDGRETILLVEDEDCVRLLARRVLEMKGYTVLAAENGPTAIRLFEAHSGSIQLVLTDVMMPEMGGRELAEQLRGRQPDLRIVFMSGYTTDEVLRQGIETEQVDFLQKPFTPDALMRKIQLAFSKSLEMGT